MANDDKVKSEDLIQISKDRFLPDEIRDKDPKHPEYSLDREFAKSAKGFDWKFYSILLIFLIVIIGGTFAVTTYIDIKNQETQFSFNIEDIDNLQDQISSTNREEKNVNLAKSELSVITKERDAKINDIEMNYSKEVEDVSNQGLSPEDVKKEIAKLKSKKESQIADINTEYAPKVSKAEEKVAKAQEEYEKKKAKLEADINKAEKIVNNYKRLQQMQIDAIRARAARDIENLRLRYNPYFTEANLRHILKSVDRKNLMTQPLLEDINALHTNKVVTEIEIKAIREKIEDYKAIIARMQKIPYTNSVAPAVDVIQSDAFFLITEYERITKKLLKNLEVLQKYQRAFNQIAEFSVDSGIVIDASNPDDVIYTLKPVVQVETGDIGVIFREADEYIATMEFVKKYGKMSAHVLETASDEKIQPLDKIFIRKKKAPPEEGSKTNQTGSEVEQKTNAPESSVEPAKQEEAVPESTDSSNKEGNPMNNTENEVNP